MEWRVLKSVLLELLLNSEGEKGAVHSRRSNGVFMDRACKPGVGTEGGDFPQCHWHFQDSRHLTILCQCSQS